MTVRSWTSSINISLKSLMRSIKSLRVTRLSVVESTEGCRFSSSSTRRKYVRMSATCSVRDFNVELDRCPTSPARCCFLSRRVRVGTSACRTRARILLVCSTRTRRLVVRPSCGGKVDSSGFGVGGNGE